MTKSLTAKLLTDLTCIVVVQKGVEFMWDTACAEAFSAMKKLLTTAPVL